MSKRRRREHPLVVPVTNGSSHAGNPQGVVPGLSDELRGVIATCERLSDHDEMDAWNAGMMDVIIAALERLKGTVDTYEG